MTKNNLLNLALIICKVLQSVYILGFILLTILFIHVQIDGEFYKDKIISIEKKHIGYNTSVSAESQDEGVTLDEMSTASLYVNYLKYSALLLLFFMAIKEFQNVIKSVQNRATFQNENFKSFRRIGQYTFIYFLVDSFYTYEFNTIGHRGFTISFTPLILMLVAFIMAEIFKEGSLLLEDKELTI